jgi:hypothetical protein
VVDLTGVDALRYTLCRYPADSPLTVDIDVVTRTASDNPVYYVQYAHARLSSILRNAADLGNRGASWAFLRYVADRRGGTQSTLWNALVFSPDSGFTNLANRLGENPLPWVRDFAAAMTLSMRRYESAASSPPIGTTWSHAAVNGAPRSASEAIATVATPSRRAVRAMRATLAARLALRTCANTRRSIARPASPSDGPALPPPRPQ